MLLVELVEEVLDGFHLDEGGGRVQVELFLLAVLVALFGLLET